jgi:hypothetical protein
MQIVHSGVLASAVPVKRWRAALNVGAGSAMLIQRMSDLEKTKDPGRKVQPGAVGVGGVKTAA